jgi:IS1 family transposase
MDRQTREIIGVYVGDRSRESAKELWKTLPPIYRQCAVIYTDKWRAYQGILPSKRHRTTEKGSGETNHIERFNNTLRQRVSRLVRKTLAFSKKLINHIGAILSFIDAYLTVL